MRQRLLISVAALACLTSIAFVTLRSAPAEPARAAPGPGATPAADPDLLQLPAGAAAVEFIQTGLAVRQALPQSEVLSARITYDEDTTARVGSTVSGRLLSLPVRPGDLVRPGQVLAVMDAPDASAALADLEKARVDEQHKEAAWKRTRALAGDASLSQREAESAEADWRQALAERQRAELRVKSLLHTNDAPIGHTLSLRSPIHGVVMERNASPSQEVAAGAGTPLFVISDPQRLAVMVDLPERLLGQVRKGDPLSLEVDAFLGEHFEARIQQIGPVLDVNTRRIPVKAVLRDPQARLMPEMYARAWVHDRRAPQALRVPNAALVTRGLSSCVFIEEAPGRFRLRRVELLQRGESSSFVGSGLQDGERIVTRGALLINAELEAQRDARS